MLDLPRDISAARLARPFAYPEAVRIRGYNSGSSIPQKQLARAALALAEAKRPLICYEGGMGGVGRIPY